MNRTSIGNKIPALKDLLADADHVDIKTISSSLPMRAFIAGMLSYSPGWLKFLYGIRWVFVRLLGMTQEGVPETRPLLPTDIPLIPGKMATFFQVTMAQDEQYWVAEASDKHLAAFLAVLVDHTAAEKQFHLVTIVKYRHWTGPVYFNVIRPFHHLVVRTMMRAGAVYQPPAAINSL
jgi:hypothetical protein